jgi:hypothetical protein
LIQSRSDFGIDHHDAVEYARLADVDEETYPARRKR